MINPIPPGSSPDVYRQKINEIIAALNTVTDFSVMPPLELSTFGGGTQLRYSPGPEFQARVTGRRTEYETYIYTCKEVQPNGIGEWEYANEPREVEATEWNNNFIDLDTIVWVKLVDNGDWRCEMSEGAGTCETIAGKLVGNGLYKNPCPDQSDGGAERGEDAPSGGSDECCKINVLPGCHILVNETGVHVDVDSLAGAGLTVEQVECSDSGDCCPRIQVAGICKEIIIPGTVTATCNDDGTITINYSTEWVRVLDDGFDCNPSESGGSGI